MRGSAVAGVGLSTTLALGALAVAALVPGLGRDARADFVKGPYLQNASPRSVTVMWESSRTTAATVIVHDKGGERRVEVAARQRHEVVIDGLAPASRYRYEVVAGADRAAGELTTAPEPGAPVPLTFVVFGDTRSSSDAHRRLIERMAAMSSRVFFTGRGGNPSMYSTDRPRTAMPRSISGPTILTS